MTTQQSDTPRCDALEDVLPWNATYIPLRDLARTLERENAQQAATIAQLREALARLEGRLRAFVSHDLDAKPRQVEHWANAARKALGEQS